MMKDSDQRRRTPLAQGVSTPSAYPAEEQVAVYLHDHLDFFVDRAELLQAMTPPSKWSGDTVVDMHRYMVESLRGEIAGLRECANEVIETSRVNLATQSRTHAAVLVLVSAHNGDALVRAIIDDMPLLLDVDVCLLSVEPSANLQLMIGGIGRLRIGDVDRFIGPGRDVALYREMADDGMIFGVGAGLVRSAALVRVRWGEEGQVAMLAFGSRRDGAFHSGQGTELLRFVGKVVEVCLRRLTSVVT